MIQGISDISQMYSALSAEVSPVKQFYDRENSNQASDNKPVSFKADLQPDRYKDILQLSNHIPQDNNTNCSCGSCPACMGKLKDESGSTDQHREKGQNSEDDPAFLKSDKTLTRSEKEEIQQLKSRDQEVRTHEQAHVSAGAKNAQYEYETGPDGKRYATGGHAEIETSKGDSPESTITKAQQIKKAALAPSNPSSQDRKVAAEAEAMIAEAQKELRSKALKQGGVAEDKPLSSQIDQNIYLKEQQEQKPQTSPKKEAGLSAEINKKIQEAVKPDDQFSVLAPFSSSQLKDLSQSYSRLNKLQINNESRNGTNLNISV